MKNLIDKNMIRVAIFRFVMISFFAALSVIASAGVVNLSKAEIIASEKIGSPVRETAIRVLQEEIAKRTAINLKHVSAWGKAGNIALALTTDEVLNGVEVPKRAGENLPESKAEGYRIYFDKSNGKDILWIIGADERGVMFGAGKLLRTAEMTNKKMVLAEPLDFASSPMHSIRGHQLGYRNLNNSTDAWTVAKYEQYIRELAIFGTNSVEMIPVEEEKRNELMQVLPDEMNRKVSGICAEYGIDYWLWNPFVGDLMDETLRQKQLDYYEQFYKNCPKLDDVFFPGGDPGDNHPREVMPFLKDLHDRLVKYHPTAGMWISLQGFSAEKIDYFYNYLEENKPGWLRGVVSGPSSPPTAETRYRLDPKYKHRLYPDITHNVRCEYPVENWDQAFMLTYGREGINPRPVYTAKIHKNFAPVIDGFVSYSDGVHDDVNKIIWSMRGWDINLEQQTILEDYCRFFFSPDLTKKAANGIFALEQNWAGPVRENGGIEINFEYWQKLEKGNPQLSGNWRWQMLVTRAYYDVYQRRRKIYEEGLENQANKILAAAPVIGAVKAMEQALEIVNRADLQPQNKDINDRIVKYCDDMFHSIGYQSDVDKYKAANSQRSCILTLVNCPLNNRWWLADEFEKIRKMAAEQAKLDRLEVIRTWENPGSGSYYDNVSNIESGPRVLTTSYDATDVAWWDGGKSRKRLSSQLFQPQPELFYENLDFNGRYTIRVSGRGEALLRVDGLRLQPVLYDKEIGGFKEFVVPKNLTMDGTIKVTFDQPEESHIRWTLQSHISDVWLIKK